MNEKFRRSVDIIHIIDIDQGFGISNYVNSYSNNALLILAIIALHIVIYMI